MSASNQSAGMPWSAMPSISSSLPRLRRICGGTFETKLATGAAATSRGPEIAET